MRASTNMDTIERQSEVEHSAHPQRAPFVLVHDFLPDDARDAIFDYLVTSSPEFEPAQMDPGLRLDIRRTSFLGNCLNNLDPRWRQIFNEKLTSAFRLALPRLGVTDFVPLGMEYHALVYRDGDFFRPHRDDEPGGSRAVTFIYNVHRRPKRFFGGELLIYDSNECSSERDYAPTHTSIPAEDNRLLLFPSHYFHEVPEVRGPVEVRDARLAINGWFHRHGE